MLWPPPGRRGSLHRILPLYFGSARSYQDVGASASLTTLVLTMIPLTCAATLLKNPPSSSSVGRNAYLSRSLVRLGERHFSRIPSRAISSAGSVKLRHM